MTNKEIKEALMEAITIFTIVEKAGDKKESCYYYMGLVHAYMGVLGEFARLGSPWEKLWHKVLHSI